MTTAAGIGLITGGLAVGLLTMFVLWRRGPARPAVVLAATTGAAVGAGGLLLTGDAGPADWVVAVGLLALLGPVHLWGLFGPPGRREPTGVVAEGPGAG